MQHQKKEQHLAKVRSLVAGTVAPTWFACQSLGLVGTIAAIAPLAIGQQQAVAALLTNWQFDPATNQLEFTLPGGSTPTYSLLQQPTRLIVEIPNTQVGTDTTQLYPTGKIRSVRLSEFRPGMARIVIDFAPDIVLTRQQIELQQVGSENRWVLRPQFLETTVPAIAPTQAPQTTAEASPPRSQPQTTAETPQQKQPESTTEANTSTPTTPPPPSVPATTAPLPVENEQIQPVKVQVRVSTNQTRRSANRSAIAQPSSLPPAPVPIAPAFTNPPPTFRPAPVAIAPALANQPRVVPYGQPLPPISPSQLDPVAGRPDVLLPAGSTLGVFYPGPEPLRLEPKPDRQEVLVLTEAIRDRNGNIIVPANTPVLGRFETNNNGSRFVAQSLYLQDRTVPLVGKSERFSGGQPKPSTRSLIRNSSIGGLAVFLLSGLSGFGLLAGAAVGLGATYATAPQPATIQPGQVFSVELTEDFLVISQ